MTSDEMKIRALKYFMLESAEDWYRASLMQLSMENFDEWKNSFLRVFKEEGWSKMRYALGFRYFSGSFADYAIKKLRLLLEVERKMTIESQINLILHGLPVVVLEKIKKQKVGDVESLINELSKLEFTDFPQEFRSQNFRGPVALLNKENMGKEFERSVGKRPCRVCESLNLPMRFHTVEKCWNSQKKKKLPSLKVNLTGREENDDDIFSKECKEKN